MKENNILKDALEIVEKRGKDYGDAHENMAHTAEIVNAAFATDFDAGDIALIMVLVKVSRELYKPKSDNLKDIAGYAWVKSQCETNAYN